MIKKWLGIEKLSNDIEVTRFAVEAINNNMISQKSKLDKLSLEVKALSKECDGGADLSDIKKSIDKINAEIDGIKEGFEYHTKEIYELKKSQGKVIGKK